jgi:antitoxin ParD1/3/4
MNKHTSFSLDDQDDAFIDQQIEQGNYDSASAVVRAGLKLLEERQAKIEALRAAIEEGERSGPPQPFDLNEFLTRMHARHVK